MHTLHTVLYTYPKVLTRRICLTIKSFLCWWSFPLFSWHWRVIQGWYCKEKLDASHSQGSMVNLMGWESEASFPNKSHITSMKYRTTAKETTCWTPKNRSEFRLNTHNIPLKRILNDSVSNNEVLKNRMIKEMSVNKLLKTENEKLVLLTRKATPCLSIVADNCRQFADYWSIADQRLADASVAQYSQFLPLSISTGYFVPVSSTIWATKM